MRRPPVVVSGFAVSGFAVSGFAVALPVHCLLFTVHRSPFTLHALDPCPSCLLLPAACRLVFAFHDSRFTIYGLSVSYILTATLSMNPVRQ